MKQEIYIRNTKCRVACVLNFRLKYTTKELSTKNDKKINYFLELCFYCYLLISRNLAVYVISSTFLKLLSIYKANHHGIFGIYILTRCTHILCPVQWSKNAIFYLQARCQNCEKRQLASLCLSFLPICLRLYPSVRPSAWKNVAPTGQIFMNVCL